MTTFLIKEILKSFIFSKKIKVGFVFGGAALPYDSVMASTRLRVYDIINAFNRSDDFFLEIYKPWRGYDIIVFQKKFDNKAYILAKKMKKKKVKIIFDINVNYYDKSFLEEKKYFQNEKILKFTEISDVVITTTSYIKNFAKRLFPEKSFIVINENIPCKYFKQEKIIKNLKKKKINFIFSGYAIKAKELLLIKCQVEKLAKKYAINYIFFCEKDPKIFFKGVKVSFFKFNNKTIHNDLKMGDLFLAPRDLSNGYNLGHSFTKIGSPMAAGVPVIASPLLSYEGSPAILVDDFGDGWCNEVEKFISNPNYYKNKSDEGVFYCHNNYSINNIKKKYITLFEGLKK